MTETDVYQQLDITRCKIKYLRTFIIHSDICYVFIALPRTTKQMQTDK